VSHSLPDLDSREAIAALVDAFYARLLQDPRLAPIFLDVAAIDLQHHLPLIRSYWEKLLLGDRRYQRHTMNIHRAVNARQAFQPEDFERWLALFCANVDQLYVGPKARRAKQLAGQIAANMQVALTHESRRLG
jgi:hemoglobin